MIEENACFSKELARDCASLGFIASQWPILREFGLGIFRAIRHANPESPVWIIGMCMIYIQADKDPAKARSYMLEKGVTLDKGDLMARAFLGLFSIMAKHTNEAENILRRVIEEGTDAEAAKFAESILNESKP